METIGDEITTKLSGPCIRPEDMVKKQRKLSEPMTNNAVVVAQTTQQVVVAQTNVVTSTATHPATQQGGIPQDITTMSDHDLISYINPSCFDQGKVNQKSIKHFPSEETIFFSRTE